MISIFLDTNILHSRSTDFTTVGFVDALQEIINEIEVNDIYNQVQVVIPQIVLDELQQQQLELRTEWAKKVSGIRFTVSPIEIPENYENDLKILFAVAVENITQKVLTKIVIADYPPNDVLQKIIQRAVLKLAPFEGKDKESDKGFKDVIIWESILAFKRANPTDQIVVFSRDKRLTDKILQNEFEQEFGDSVTLIYRNDMNSFDDLIQKVVDFTKADKQQRTYAQALKDRLIAQICNELVEPLYEDMTYKYRDVVWDIDGVIVSDAQIISSDDIDDEISEYNVIISAQFSFSDLEGITMSERFDCPFKFLYRISTDTFYLYSYTSPDGNEYVIDCELGIE